MEDETIMESNLQDASPQDEFQALDYVSQDAVL